MPTPRDHDVDDMDTIGRRFEIILTPSTSSASASPFRCLSGTPPRIAVARQGRCATAVGVAGVDSCLRDLWLPHRRRAWIRARNWAVPAGPGCRILPVCGCACCRTAFVIVPIAALASDSAHRVGRTMALRTLPMPARSMTGIDGGACRAHPGVWNGSLPGHFGRGIGCYLLIAAGNRFGCFGRASSCTWQSCSGSCPRSSRSTVSLVGPPSLAGPTMRLDVPVRCALGASRARRRLTSWS